MSMHPSALLLIKDNETVQRLVVAWPRVPIKRGDRQKRLTIWARLAGVRRRDAETYHDLLFENEVCRMDGSVDPLADGFLTRLALAKLPRDMHPKLPPEKAAGA